MNSILNLFPCNKINATLSSFPSIAGGNACGSFSLPDGGWLWWPRWWRAPCLPSNYCGPPSPPLICRILLPINSKCRGRYLPGRTKTANRSDYAPPPPAKNMTPPTSFTWTMYPAPSVGNPAPRKSQIIFPPEPANITARVVTSRCGGMSAWIPATAIKF